jgi:arylsulfatase A-like enzyme
MGRHTFRRIKSQNPERIVRKISTKGFISDVLTDRAINFIKSNSNKPFFCYVPYNAPHTPCKVPDKYFDKYRARGFDIKHASIYGMAENLDDNLNQLLNSLKDQNLEQDTIVFFLTDNGPNSWRYNSGMKGKKGHIAEGGVRVSFRIEEEKFKYMTKKWKVFKCGKLYFEQGEYPLQLKALLIPGSLAIKVKELSLKML